MRRIGIAVLAAVAGVVTPAAARAQSFVTNAPGRPMTQQTIPVRMSGRIIVQFHGDPSAGCAVHGLCGYVGTVSWSAPQSAALNIQTSRQGGRAQYTVTMFPQPLGPGGQSGGITSAQVTQTSSPGESAGTTCADAVSAPDALPLTARNGRVRFSLAGTSVPLFATRCAGPRDGVIMPLLPAPRLSVARLRQGRLTLRLEGSVGFAADGFTGTVVSDLRVRLGRPGRTTRVRAAAPVGRPRHALRLRLRATLAGSVVEHVAADPHPGVCLPLGACGATGTLMIHPQTSGAPAQVQAVASAGGPAPELSAVDRARQISVFGTALWSSGGTVDAIIGQNLTQCTDSAPLDGGLLTLVAAHGRLTAAYSAAGFLTGAPSVTGCPGPGGFGSSTALAAGSVPVSWLARRRITIRLTTGGGIQDYGYRIRTTPDLTLTLIRLSARPVTVPAY